MDRGAWWAAVHGVAKSRIRLSDFTFIFYFYVLEKEMATHSSVLAWRIPGTGEPGGLPSMGSHRVGHDWSNLAAAAYIWKRNFIPQIKFNPQGFTVSGRKNPMNFFLCKMIHWKIFYRVVFTLNKRIQFSYWLSVLL